MEIIRSTNFGDSWDLSNAGLPSDAYSVVIRESQNGSIFAGTTNHGVYRSTDSGLSWNAANSGLNSSYVKSIVINSQGKIYAGTSNGVFVSIDNGESWLVINSGLFDVYVLSLQFDSLEYLYVATNSTGVYRSTLSTTSVEGDIHHFEFLHRDRFLFPEEPKEPGEESA